MSAIDLNHYAAAGYFITKYATTGFWPSPIMPERVVSLSACIGKPLKAYWGHDIDQSRDKILGFGIPAEKLTAFKEWSKSQGLDYSGVFKSVKATQQFIADFLPRQEDIALVGAAMRKEEVDDFLFDDEDQTSDLKKQAHLDRLRGADRILSQRRPLEDGGEVLGFEIVSYYYADFHHSWLCGGLEKDMNELFSIRPNQYGLIATYEEAKKVDDWIAEDDQQGHRGELGEPYYSWLLVQYPLTALTKT